MSATSRPTQTPLERVLTTLSFNEPDRVPFFLLLTTHGARALSMSIRDYFTDAQAITEGQITMQRRYRHDCLYAFTYAAIETEAWGGEVIFADDGPPNAGPPLATTGAEIDHLQPPSVADASCLQRIITAIRLMRERVGPDLPIIGVVMAPFSLPVMQLGFAAYLNLLYDDRDRFWRLMAKNEAFCAEWANAQVEAGATAICYFDPVSSPQLVPREVYVETGYQVALRTTTEIKAPIATHMGSADSIGIADLVAQTRTAVMGFGANEDPAEAKRVCAGKLSLIGNLDGITMRSWSPGRTEARVKDLISKAGPGGGFILCDNHGEIHYSTPEAVLDQISAAVHRWGAYPLDWVE